jgi:hypothetical protein
LLILEEIDILSVVCEALFAQGDEDLLGADGIEVAIHLEHEKLPRRTDHYPLQCAVRKSYLKMEVYDPQLPNQRTIGAAALGCIPAATGTLRCGRS